MNLTAVRQSIPTKSEGIIPCCSAAEYGSRACPGVHTRDLVSSCLRHFLQWCLSSHVSLFNPYRVAELGSPHHTRFHRALFIFNPSGVVQSEWVSPLLFTFSLFTFSLLTLHSSLLTLHLSASRVTRHDLSRVLA